ncbi:MAG: tRNA lysidine(34) synthetase TilS [Actinomycetota bacterium]
MSRRPDVAAWAGLASGDRVVVACSGGTDSLALLAWACDHGLVVTAVYVDHGLRAGTDLEARLVAAAADRFGASARPVTVVVGHGPNLEARARAARYAALEQVRIEVGAVAVCTGHTRDDQAETVLLNLLRGSAGAGLAGIAPRRGTVVRPLLGLRRADTSEQCARLGLAPAHDPMNDDLHHRRVWLRREVLPMLDRGADRDLVEVLARQAEVLRGDEALLDGLAAAHATTDAAALTALDPALAARVVRRWLGSPPVGRSTVERVLAVARGDRLATALPGGTIVERIGGRLVRVAGPADAAPPAPVALVVPGRTGCGAFAIEARVERAAPVAWPDGRWIAVCDADRIGADARVEAGTRAPVVTAGTPVWRVGYGVARAVRASSRTRRFLWLHADHAPSPERA